MDLLNQIFARPVDPDYALAGARGRRASGPRWLLALAAVLVGALLAVSAVQATRSAPQLERERRDLVSRIGAAEEEQDRLRDQVVGLAAETDRLRAAALGDDAGSRALQRQIDTLEPAVGAAPVRGPGLVVVVDDAPAATLESRQRVLDLDLQILVNGLWASGAEAVAVNGHRLSSLTAIRSAGEAITVDYRSLTPPYRVEAIGDPRTLAARFVESPAGAWWNELAQNQDMAFETRSVPEMTLAVDPGLVLRQARVGDR